MWTLVLSCGTVETGGVCSSEAKKKKVVMIFGLLLRTIFLFIRVCSVMNNELAS